MAAELGRLATAIGGEHADAAQHEQALIIAESELTLLRVRAVRTNIFEQVLLATGAMPRAKRAAAMKLPHCT